MSRRLHDGHSALLGVYVVVILCLGREVLAETPVIRVYSKGLTPCGKDASMPVELTNTSWSMPEAETNVFEMSGTLVVKQELDSPVFGMVAVSKCDPSGSMCMNILTHSIMDICDDLRKKNTLLNDFASRIEDFPMNCPIPAGEYYLPPFKFPLNKDTKCGDLGGEWKMLIKLLIPGNATLMCHNWRTQVEVEC